MTGERYYYHANHQGSITHLTNEMGEIVETFTYDNAYGIIQTHNKTEETYNPYCYTAREYDSHDLYYYRARYYDPTLGRFISSDPIEFLAGDFNFYRYVGNDPVNWIDPSGLAGSNKGKDSCAKFLKKKRVTGKIKIKPKDILKKPNLPNIAKEVAKETIESIITGWILGEIEKSGAVVYEPEYIGPGSEYFECKQKEAKKTQGSGGVKVIEGAGDVGKASKDKTSIWSETKKKKPVKNAFDHYKKHKNEFPEYKNSKEYVEGTKKFLNNPPKGTLTKINSKGDILRYNPKTNTFGVLSKDGVPRTMFRPEKGIEYWNMQ